MERLGNILQSATDRAVVQLGKEAQHLWHLAGLTDTASAQTEWKILQERRELAALQLAALEEEAADQGPAHRLLYRRVHGAAVVQLDAQIAEHRQLLQLTQERDAIQASRPAGCWCLGLGGGGYIMQLKPAVLWSKWCSCPEGQRLQDIAAEGDVAEEARVAALEAQRIANEAAADYQRRLKAANIPYHKREFTFDSFPADSRKDPVIRRMKVLGAAGEHARGIFLWGDCGVGKSGLAIATLQAWLQNGHEGVFIDAAAWLDSQRPGHGPPAITLERLVRIPLVIVDDLGVENPSEWVRERLHLIVAGRHDAQRPTIYTSNYDLETTAARLAGFAPGQDGSTVDAKRGGWRILESCDVVELCGRNLREPGAL